ncbi:TetR family transcriptional regulator [uncultured Roseibium sp.]|uniref:TetR/AcrR family transcriptional regulator n=1 Tax=uncultured Roseibium sp. TaxID=1936171 RepID=UPI002595D29F|nr:TetR family transcriptional regulator [uncultured Roseibium sp.]
MNLRQTRKPPTTKIEILGAALDIVREAGALSLTIDAVAERSGFSKGGVLYNFPTKDILVVAMVQHVADRFAVDVEERRQLYLDADSPTLAAMIDVTERWIENELSVARALMVANLSFPGLVAPILELKSQLKSNIQTETADLTGALVIWSALEGLQFSNAHCVALHTDEERLAVLAELRRRVSVEGRR